MSDLGRSDGGSPQGYRRWRGVAAAATAVVVTLGTLVIAAPSASADAPANDDIGGATVVSSLPYSATQDSLTATQDAADPTPSCGAPNGFTVWYAFTPTVSQTVQVTMTGGDFFPPIPTIYSGPANATSSSTLTEVECNTNATQLTLTAGTTYYFMLGSFTARPSFTFDLAAIVPPANDDIGGATVVTSLPFSATQDSLTVTQDAADPSPSCGAPNGFTVWYAFTPTVSQTVQVTMTGGDFFPPIPTIYSGPANATSSSTLTEVECNTNATQLTLTAGTTYYFMLGSFTARPAFTFNVVSLSAPTGVSAAAGNDRVRVSWTAPVADGGSPITGYTVTAYVGSSPVKEVTYSSTDTAQDFTGLVNGQHYRFTVAAVTDVGTGDPSEPSNLVRFGPPVVKFGSSAPKSVLEGASGLHAVTANVNLDLPSIDPITVFWNTQNGTAAARDYVGAFGWLTFAPGETRKVITVMVKGDTKPEPDEVFFLQLSAQLSVSLKPVTIINDD